MLILVNPMLSAELVNSDSNYCILRALLPAVLQERPDWLIEVLWPSNSGDWKYYDDGLFSHPNIRRRPTFIQPNKMTQVISFDTRMWEKMLGYKDGVYDVIWNNVVEQGGNIRLFEPRYHVSAANVVVNFHHYVMHKSLPYPVERVYEHVLLAQLAGSLPVHANVVNTDHCFNMLMDNAENYLSEDQCVRLSESVVQIPYGTLNKAEFSKAQTKRHDTFTFVWNHRFQNYKRWRDVFALFDQLWTEREGKFQVQVHASAAMDAIQSVAPKPYVRIVETPGHEQYLRELSRCHANVTGSIHETFCIAAVESMAYGQTLIAPDGVTFPQITGKTAKNDTYPFLYRKGDECYDAMKACVDEPTLATKWGKRLEGHVWSEYADHITANRIIDLFEGLASQDVVSTLKRRDEWEKILGERDRWEIDTLRKLVYRSVSNEGSRLAADQSFPVIKIKRVANEFGFTDSWDKAGRLVLTRG